MTTIPTRTGHHAATHLADPDHPDLRLVRAAPSRHHRSGSDWPTHRARARHRRRRHHEATR